MKKILITCFAAFASLFGFASCSGNASEIEGTWVAKELKLEGTNYQVVPAEITFEKATASSVQVHGNGGVNIFNGKIKINKDKIDFGDKIAMTRMMGDPVSMAFEDALIEIINTSDKFTVENDKLTIFSSKADSYVIYYKK